MKTTLNGLFYTIRALCQVIWLQELTMTSFFWHFWKLLQEICNGKRLCNCHWFCKSWTKFSFPFFLSNENWTRQKASNTIKMLCKGNTQILFIVHLLEWNSLEIFWKLNCIYCDVWRCPRIKQRSEAFWRVINLSSVNILGENTDSTCFNFFCIALWFLLIFHLKQFTILYYFINGICNRVYSKEFERKIVE